VTKSRKLGHVFPNRKGRLLDENNLRRVFDRLMKDAKVKRQKGDGPYLFRHTHVSHLLHEGVPITTVAQRVGDRPRRC
jgi:site-specific recombinase XerD